jgi:hypothetical protein
MKRSEAILKLTRAYHIRHVMVEGGHITPQEFMEEMLSVVEGLGMIPPEHYRPHDWHERGITYSQWIQEPSKIRTWEPEDEKK